MVNVTALCIHSVLHYIERPPLTSGLLGQYNFKQSNRLWTSTMRKTWCALFSLLAIHQLKSFIYIRIPSGKWLCIKFLIICTELFSEAIVRANDRSSFFDFLISFFITLMLSAHDVSDADGGSPGDPCVAMDKNPSCAASFIDESETFIKMLSDITVRVVTNVQSFVRDLTLKAVGDSCSYIKYMRNSQFAQTG